MNRMRKEQDHRHIDPQLLAPLMREGESSSTNPLASIIESPISSLMKDKSVAAHLASYVPNKDVSHLKSNIAFTERMEELDINIDDVAAAVQTLRTREELSEYNDYTLTLMALGNEYFKKVASSGFELKPEHSKILKKVMGDYVKSDKFKDWRATRTYTRVSFLKLYGKMLWLAEMGDFKMSDEQDLVEMTFGSELFSSHNIKLNLPSPIQGGDTIATLDQLKHQVEQMAKRHDVDPKVIDKLRALAEDPGSIGKTKKEIIERARDAVLDDVIDRLKRQTGFTQRMEDLEINIDGVKVAVQSLRKQPGLLKYDDYTLYLMAFGSEYFKKVASYGFEIKPIHPSILKTVVGEYVKSAKFKDWRATRTYTRVSFQKMYGKMRWLAEMGDFKMNDEQDLVEMAFGSELFSSHNIKLNLPSPIQGGDTIATLDQLKHQVEQMAKRHDVDPKVIDKLRALAGDPGSIGKTKKEILKIARDAVLDDVVDHLKSKKAFTQRMEDLEINIDGVKIAAQSLRKQPGLLKYDDSSLYLMTLGSEYFKKVERGGVKIESLPITDFWLDVGKYRFSPDYNQWEAERKHSLVRKSKFYGKMRRLKRDQHLKLLNDDELVNMAFGSEFFPAYKIEVNVPSPIQGGDKIETLDQLKHQIEQMAKQNDVDPKVIDKLRVFADDPGSIGKTRKEILKRAKDAVLDDELDRLKSNKAFTQWMEELKINIDDLNGPMQRLREQVGHLKYDEYSLYLMALGSKYFEKVEHNGANIKSLLKYQFERDMNEYATSDDFKRWKEARKYFLRGRLDTFYGRMRLLKRDKHLELLKGEELANMAFGSELSKNSESKLTPLPPIEDEEKIETLDQLNRLINQLPSGGNGEPNVKKSLEDILKKDPKAYIGQTAKQLKRKADHEAVGVLLGEETNKKPHVE